MVECWLINQNLSIVSSIAVIAPGLYDFAFFASILNCPFPFAFFIDTVSSEYTRNSN